VTRTPRAVAACVAAVLVSSTPSARAAQLVADLADHLVAITTGFTGADVLLFGATDSEGDIVVVVQGPRGPRSVRRKGRMAGIWVKGAEARFSEVPGYYWVGATRPVEDIVPDNVGALYQIGLRHLRLPAPTGVPAESVGDFRTALIRAMQRDQLYSSAPARIAFLGNRLFRTDVRLPANAPVGPYTAAVYHLRGGEVISASLTPLLVSKVGFEARVYEFAHRYALAYGVLAVLIAAMAGWLANLVFRRD